VESVSSTGRCIAGVVATDVVAHLAMSALARVPLNINEATGRVGGDRAHLFRCALGSLREVTAMLDTAEALGWIAEPPLAAERDRLGGMLWGLQRR
jgi:four helix bundle protein